MGLPVLVPQLVDVVGHAQPRSYRGARPQSSTISRSNRRLRVAAFGNIVGSRFSANRVVRIVCVWQYLRMP